MLKSFLLQVCANSESVEVQPRGERDLYHNSKRNVSGKSSVQIQDELAEPKGPRKRVHEFPQHFIL